jgi:hypothetical protein
LEALMPRCSILWFSLFVSACVAPMSGTPTALPMAPGRADELALDADWGMSYDRSTGKVDRGAFDTHTPIGDACDGVPLLPWDGTDVCAGPSLAFHYRHQVGRIDVGGLAFYGNTSSIGGGVSIQARAVQQERFVLAFGGQLGWFWGSLDASVAARVAPDVWVYATPSVGFREWNLAAVALGAQYARGGLEVGVELNVGIDAAHGDLGVSVGHQF